MNRRWSVNSKLDGVELFVKRALAVEDKYTQIVNGEYEFHGDPNDPSSIENNDIDDIDALDAEDVAFLEYDEANDILRFYEEIVLRVALNEINSIVEYELKSIASTAKSKQLGKPVGDCWINNRGEARNLIEEVYKIQFETLSGFANVDWVREIINAYKHDDGYSKEYEPFVGHWIEKQKKYELNFDDILDYVHNAKEFLLALPDVGSTVVEDMARRTKINLKKSE